MQSKSLTEAMSLHTEQSATTQLRCAGCHLRVPRSMGPSDALCPGCGAPLVSCRARDVVGYRLAAPGGLPWAAVALDAVAEAVAQALPDPRRSL